MRALPLLTLVVLALTTPVASQAQTFDPASYGSVVLWLDGQDASSLTIGADDGIAAWLDRSGLGNDVFAAGTARPEAVDEPAEPGTGVSARFDGADDLLCGNTDLSLSSGATLFLVTRNTVRKDYNGLFSLRSVTAGHPDPVNAVAELYWQVGSSGSGNLVWSANRDASHAFFRAPNAPPSLAAWSVVSVRVPSAPATGSMRSNGDDLALDQVVGTNFVPSTSSVPCLGYGFGVAPDVGTLLDGGIAEVVVYNEALAAGDILAVEEGLYDKWLRRFACMDPGSVTAHTTEAAFAAAAAGPLTTLDFESAAAGTSIPSGSGLSFATFEYDLDGATLEVTERHAAPSGVRTLGQGDADQALLDGDRLDLSFSSPVSAFGLKIVSSDPLVPGEVGVSTPYGCVETSGLPEAITSDLGFTYFLGATSTLLFTEASIEFAQDDGQHFVYGLDDLAIETPEPGFALGAMAGASLLAALRRRRPTTTWPHAASRNAPTEHGSD